MSHKIAIIGAGLVGRAWAISFARSGNTIKLFDVTDSALTSAMNAIKTALIDLAENDLLHGKAVDSVHSQITTAGTLGDALKSVDYVQESSPENLEIKKKVFKQLDEIAGPETILASSSSALVPSMFTENLKGRDRCLVAHPINPPYLIPAVELCPSPWTSKNVMTKAHQIMEEAGHAPISMARELDGFIMNRLQGALLQEAFRLVADGYASVADIDRGLKQGLALRWSFMGPFETIDLNAPGGVRDYVERYSDIYARMASDFARPVDMAGPIISKVEGQRRKLLTKDRLSERQVWRDKRLMALAVHKKDSDNKYGK